MEAAEETRPEITSIDLSGGNGSQVLMGDSDGRVCLYAPPANHPKAVPVKQRVPRIWHPAFTRGLDCLRSVEVEAKVHRAVLMPRRAPNVTSYMVANAQTVKLYRMREHLGRPKSKSVVPVCSFTGPHIYAPIHSLSLCSDEQTFLSADDFQVQWWHFEAGDGAKPFCLADIHPRQGDANFEVSELLTAASFHPTHGSLFLLSSSDGWTSIGDLRDPPSRRKRNYATTLATRPEHNIVQHNHNDILCSVADAAFLQANYVVTRDYLSLKVWDIRKPGAPTSVLPVHECLAGHLDELYDSDAIFDRFSISVDQQTGTVVSGLYDARVVVWQPESGQEPLYIRGSTGEEGATAGAVGPLQWSEEPAFTAERVSNVGISGGGSTVAFSSHDKLFVFDRVRSGSSRS